MIEGLFRLVPAFMWVPLLLTTLLTGLVWAWFKKVERSYDREKFMKLPGPDPLPIIGNANLLIGRKRSDRIKGMTQLHDEYGPVVRYFIGPFPRVLLKGPDNLRAVMSDARFNDKGAKMYSFIEPWLGKGLITNNGSAWHSRRKLLTPTFHFQILKEFLPIMRKQVRILVDEVMPQLLADDADLANKGTDVSTVDLDLPLHRCALDIICEAAMGQDLQIQMNPESEYPKALNFIQQIVSDRMVTPWMMSDAMFAWHPTYKEYKRSLKIVHDFTDELIQRRKEMIASGEVDLSSGGGSGSGKRRLAFLDMIIKASDNGRLLSDNDIREEVNTIAFAGQDTSATSILYTLYALAKNQECQKRVQEELSELFGDDPDRDVTLEDIPKMKYLSCCIKEAMRLYSTVPGIIRACREDLDLEGYHIPANVELTLYLYEHHRDPAVFPNPEKYDPDRFSRAENEKWHPYAFIPFSAGGRNCIGQKFAEMEQRVALSTILRSYEVLGTTLTEEELKDGMSISFTLGNSAGFPLMWRRRSHGD